MDGIRIDSSSVSPTPGDFLTRTHISSPFGQAVVKAAKHLPSLKHLAVVEIDLTTYIYTSEQPGKGRYTVRSAPTFKDDLDAWKALLIRILRESPSKGRKFVRWRGVERYTGDHPYLVVAESGELEVFPERPV